MGELGTHASSRLLLLYLYDAMASDVYRYLYRMSGGDSGLAEDLTQETFLTAVGRFSDGRGDEVSPPWLMGVARHKLLEHRRREGREQRRMRLVLARSDDEASAREWRGVSRDEAAALLKDVAGDQRTALALRYVEDLPVAEVAAAIGRSVRATESLLARARRSLRRQAEETGDA